MRKLLLTGAALLLLGGAAQASSLDIFDPLHGTVCTGAGTGCTNTDNGTYAPLPGGSVSNWGFDISPGPATGNLTLLFLVPTDQINVSTFNLPTLTDNGGGALGTSVFSRTTLLNSTTGGNGAGGLAGYIGDGALGFSPTDNFSNASAGTAANDPTWPGATGSFLVFTLTLNGLFLNDQGSTTLTNDFSFGSNLPDGTVIAALFVESLDKQGNACTMNCNIGTAASGDLVVTPFNNETPIPGAAFLFLPGLGLILAGLRKHRGRSLST